jgi:VanZ family protein
LANILLYLPFGLFAAKALAEVPTMLRVFACLFAGAALSVCVEFSQMYDLGRVSAMSDVYANSFGAFLGGVAGTAWSFNFHLFPLQGLRRRPFALLLLFCWLAYRLFPYVPVIDLHKYWHAVRPLLQGPSPAFVDLLRYGASWLAVGALLESAWGSARARCGLLPLVAVVFCARIALADVELSGAEVIGGFASAAIWVTCLYAKKHRMVVIAAALAAAVVVEALQPFQFLRAARAFCWIPFFALMNGPISMVVPSLMAKTFLYGTLVWSFLRLGLRWTSATAVGALLVFPVHYLQVYLPGRSAEITDTLLIVLAGALIKMMDEGGERELGGL